MDPQDEGRRRLGADASLTPRPETARLAPFWAAAAQGRLEMPRCVRCDRFNWYPAPVCVACGGDVCVWAELFGPPRIFSWAVSRRALDLRMAALAPFATVMLEFEEGPGVRLVTRLIGTDFAELEGGATGRIVFYDLGFPAAVTGVVAPLFVLP